MADLLGLRVTGAIDNKVTSGGWPFAHVLTVSTTDPDADYADVDDAITAASAGDTIQLDSETFTGPYTLNKDITLKGSARGDTIITNNSGTTTLTVSTAGARVEDVTVTNTSTGNAVDVTAATATLERVIAETIAASGSVKSAIATTSATKCTLIDCEATASGGSLSNAALLVTSSAICEVRGGKYDGSTYDVSCATNNTVNIFGAVLVNGLVLSTGAFNWMPEAKIVKNLLYHSLTHDIWQAGTTFNDIADDTYVADLWNVLQNGQAPDVSGQAGGSTDPFTRYFRCTFDSAASQCGIVQFLTNEDTIPLRGQTVSLSFDAWSDGSVAELRAAVLSWGSTADTLTSDVVGTWSTNNPTLATNWSYANTPGADIVITSVRARYTVNNITIPTTANNIAVFIWTSAEEASTDLFNIARVQLERGPVATEFVARTYNEELASIYKKVPLTDWTPTITQSGDVTFTNNGAKYSVENGIAFLTASMTITGTGTTANAVIIAGWPTSIAPTATGTSGHTGTAVIFNSGTAFYVGACVFSSSTNIKFVVHLAVDFVGIAPGFALASPDTITFTIIYQLSVANATKQL